MNEHIFDRAKWQSRSIIDQMGNIGSEVGRSLAAKKSGNRDDMLTAFYRGIDLIDATVEGLIAKHSPRAKEVLRARELFAESVLTKKEDPGLEEYFMQFAIAQRKMQFR